MEEKVPNKGKIIWYKHILVSYFWIFIFVLIGIIIYFNNTIYQETGPIRSQAREFNYSEDPFYFVHLTDVHISNYFNYSTEYYEKAIEWSKKALAKHIITTGDLVDNWDRNKLFKMSHQNKKDHVLYNISTTKFAEYVDILVDIPGNHDEFGLYSFDSENHDLQHYSHFYSQIENLQYENFTVMPFNLTDDIVLICISMAIYPYSLGLIDTDIYLNTALLDRIEETLEEYQNKGKELIVITHHPVHSTISEKSSKGRTYKDIIGHYNISAVFCGHLHPENFWILHFNQNIQFIGSDLKKHQHIQIGSIDNGNIVYNLFSTSDKLKAIVTNPQPINQISRHSTFSYEKVPIRMLVWSNNTIEEIFVHGDVEGKLQPVRTIKENLTLYEYNASIPKGKHQITFSGYYNGKLEFFNGDELDSYSESVGDFDREFIYIPDIYYGALIIFIIILFPFNIESCFPTIQKIVDEYLEWLSNANNSLRSFILSMFFGFFITRWKIQKVTLPLRWILFIVAFSIYFVPVCIQDIEGHIGFVSFYGYTNGGHTTPSLWGPLFRLMHAFAIVWPFICLTSFLSMCINKSDWTIVYVLDILFVAFCFIFFIVFTLLLLTQTTYVYYALTSPLLILEFIVIVLIILIDWFYRRRKQFNYSKINAEQNSSNEKDERMMKLITDV